MENSLNKVKNKSPVHGKCAEIDILNQAIKDNQNLNGAKLQTAKVRGINGDNAVHGTAHTPCSTCTEVLSEHDVGYII